MSKEVTLVQGDEWETLKKQAVLALKSGFLPKSIRTPEQAAIIALKGRELGLPVMQSLNSITVIQGKPTLSAELMLALVYRHIQDAKISFVETTDQVCKIHASRGGAEPSEFIFTIEHAEQAGLLRTDTWKKYPQNMLRARCISNVCRALFPDAIAGCYTLEEMESVSQPRREPRDVTPEIKSIELPPIGTDICADQTDYGDPKNEIEDAEVVTEESVFSEPEPLNSHTYKIDFGKYNGRTFREIERGDLQGYSRYIKDKLLKDKKEPDGKLRVFLEMVDAFWEEIKDEPNQATEIVNKLMSTNQEEAQE